jgi:tetratricopeptide (TPR) repeat protein
MNRFGNSLGSLAAAALVLFAAAGGTFAQQSVSRITGQVFGENRRPVSDVYVELKNEIETNVARTRTNSSGTYSFNDLSAGRFYVHVRPFGTNYEEQIQEVEITTRVGGRNVADIQYKDFYLKVRVDPRSAPQGPAGVIFAQPVPDPAKKLYDKAVVDLNDGRVDAGILGLEEAVKAFPDYFLAIERLGVEMLKKQKYAEAGNYFAKAVAVNGKSSNSYYGLAFARYAEQKFPESIEAAKKAADLAPDSADINLMLGIALRKGRNYLDAERSMLKAKKISNGLMADASWNLALLYVYNLKNNRLAADELENYLKVNPTHPDAARLKKLIAQFRLSS